MRKNYTHIALNALEYVIPYYYKFGWRFIRSCRGTERPAMKKQVEHLRRIILGWVDPNGVQEKIRPIKINGDGTYNPDLLQKQELKKVLSNFPKIGFYSDRVKNASAAAHISEAGTASEEDRDAFSSTAAAHAETKRDAGYRMMWCPSPEELASESGRRTKAVATWKKKKAAAARGSRRPSARSRASARRAWTAAGAAAFPAAGAAEAPGTRMVDGGRRKKHRKTRRKKRCKTRRVRRKRSRKRHRRSRRKRRRCKKRTKKR